MYIESEIVELKEKMSNTLCREIVSFLNADGGTIYIGVKDNGEVVGVSNIDQACRGLADIITNQIEPNPQEIVKMELIYDDGKIIVSVSIKKGTSPIYCEKKYGFSSAGCSIRVGTTCQAMTQEHIKIRYEKRFFGSDLLVTSPTNYSLLSFKTLKIYYSEKGFHLDDKSFEANLFLKTVSDEYNKLAELLSDHNTIPIIFVKFKGADKASISERSDYGHQCLLFSYEQLMNRVAAENICLTDTTSRPRKDIYLYDIDAVNEAIVNALVHNDWSITEPLVSFFSDRIEILSHGGLPHNQTKEQFYEGISKPRNEKLMRIFLDMGIVEHTGHGVPKIIAKYGREVFDINDSYIKVTIPFNKDILDKQDDSSLDNGPGPRLTGTEIDILDSLLNNPYHTALSLSKNLGRSQRTAERALSSLQNKGFIARIGSKKTGSWRVIK